jgi:hypothetical protein
MPSPFDQSVAANLDQFYATFGIPGVAYTDPSGGVTSDIIVRIHRNEAREVERENGTVGEMQTGEILVRQTELANVVKGGRFTLEGVEVWTVATTPPLYHGEFHCTCYRSGTERLMDRRAKDNG